MGINIPQKLSKRLTDDNGKWRSRVEKLQELLVPILDQTPAFFPEYTNHGIRHVNTVLELAANLIHGKNIQKNILTSREIACLIASILIHDLGMFLTPAGVAMLMTEAWDDHRNTALDKTSWQAAWEQYISSAKRLPKDQMLRCFGKELRVENTRLDKTELLRDDQLVIGEFLRRNHPRLAHEIAEFGLPGSTVQHLLKEAGFEEDERSVIGLMARSHGMALREVETYLGPGTHHYNMPVYYLMSILRLADILDASEDRAPMVRLKQEDLTSPLSREEWALNQCFKIDSSRWYPETKNYTVQATPKTSSEYVRLEKWLNDAQYELDLCWSILAQKYPDGKLKLSIHRILCTMHEKTKFESISESILLREVKVTANPKIVELMMEPLYGKEPTYGVRELLQNAVDACVERKEWERRHGDPDYKGLVDIRIENDTFTITDNGMGMNEDILLNYYLSAGASYRDSESWKADNAPEGTSQVARTGRFGVGFLAAFLLGDRIAVHTQHRKDQKGYVFEFDQRSMPLDVTREKRTNAYAPKKDGKSDPTGTTITIQLKPEAIEGRRSDDAPDWYSWYAFDEPRVEYRMNGSRKYHQYLTLAREPARNPDWLELDTKDYETYLWRPRKELGDSEFYCNGIRIHNGYPNGLESQGLNVNAPHVSLIDKNARLDVDLARKKLKTIPEKEALFREVFRWHIARLLLTPWDTEEACRDNLTLGFCLQPDGTWGRVSFLLSPGGFALNYDSVLSAIPLREYVILYYEGTDAGTAIRTARDFLGEVPCSIVAANALDLADSAAYRLRRYYYHAPGAFARDLLNPTKSIRWSENALLYHNYAIRYLVRDHINTVWLREDVWQDMEEDPRDPLPLADASCSDGLLTAHFYGRSSAMPISRDRFPLGEFPFAAHVKLDERDSDLRRYSDSLFTRTLKEVLTPAEGYDPNDLWIPFDMAERERKFQKAFSELEPYMKRIRAEQEREARRKAEEAAREAQRRAEEAEFESFKAEHAQEISVFQSLFFFEVPQTLPPTFSSFLAIFIAAIHLKRPMESVSVEAIQELAELFREHLGLDAGEIALDELDTDPEKLAEILFILYKQLDVENLVEGVADNEDAAAILDALNRLKETLPEA